MDKPLRLPEPVVETGKTREARSVVALSRVPCGEQGVLVSPPAAGQISWGASRLPRRLVGLLSGYLPTDTRPQARAKLGNSRNNPFKREVQAFYLSRVKKLYRLCVARILQCRFRGERG